MASDVDGAWFETVIEKLRGRWADRGECIDR